MELLDQDYLKDLVIKTQGGSSNAFAELFAATCQNQYAYAFRCVGDAALAKIVLRETYIRALKSIGSLQNPDSFIVWLGQINYRVSCEKKQHTGKAIARRLRMEEEGIDPEAGILKGGIAPDRMVDVDGRGFSLGQILSLPPSESQAVLMKYGQKMTSEEIGRILNMGGSSLRRCLRAGKKHLERMDF